MKITVAIYYLPGEEKLLTKLHALSFSSTKEIKMLQNVKVSFKLILLKKKCLPTRGLIYAGHSATADWLFKVPVGNGGTYRAKAIVTVFYKWIPLWIGL